MGDNLLLWKSERQSQEWLSGRIHPRLADVFLTFVQRAQADYNWTPTVTSIYRTPEEDLALKGSGVHVVWRAIDIRSVGVDPAHVEKLCVSINDEFWYDMTRAYMLCALNETEEWCKLHGLSESAMHVHLQARDETRRKV